MSIEWQKVNGKAPLLPSGSSKKGAAAPSEASILKGLQFENRFLLRRCNNADGPSCLPANEVNFAEGGSAPAPSRAKNAPLAPEFTCSVDGGRLTIQVPQGLSQSVVRERRARQLERQKKAEARRRREDKARQERRAEREVEREAERLQRLAEKKAKKAQEKEAKRAAEEEKLSASASAATKGGRRFGAAPSPNVPSDSDSRRSSPTPMDGSRSGSPKPAGDGRTSPKMGGGGGGAPSSAASELAAAMAKRRAKADA